MEHMSIERQIEAITLFQKGHDEPIAMSNVKSHKLIVTNIGFISSQEMVKLSDQGFYCTIFSAENVVEYYGLETYISEKMI